MSFNKYQPYSCIEEFGIVTPQYKKWRADKKNEDIPSLPTDAVFNIWNSRETLFSSLRIGSNSFFSGLFRGSKSFPESENSIVDGEDFHKYVLEQFAKNRKDLFSQLFWAKIKRNNENAAKFKNRISDLDQCKINYLIFIEEKAQSFLKTSIEEIINTASFVADDGKETLSLIAEGDKQTLLNLLNPESLETKQECLSAHREITKICRNSRKNAKERSNNTHVHFQGGQNWTVTDLEAAQEKINAIERLSKRYIDRFYFNPKKMTRTESRIKELNALAYNYSLYFGIVAAICTIISFAFPPAAIVTGPLATFFGYMTAVYFIPLSVSIYTVAKEAVVYNRPPSYGEIGSIVFETGMAPLLFVGGVMLTKLGGWLAHLIKHGAQQVISVFNLIGNIWDGIFSNISDIFSPREMIANLKFMFHPSQPDIKNLDKQTKTPEEKEKKPPVQAASSPAPAVEAPKEKPTSSGCFDFLFFRKPKPKPACVHSSEFSKKSESEQSELGLKH
jgi:hypothetical protein